MDPRLTAVPVVLELAHAVADLVTGVYVGGSVATGDYRPGISDIDAVALVHRVPTSAHRSVLVATHRDLARDIDAGAALHCVYLPRHDVANLARRHWTWGFDELFRRPFSGIARAELLADPVVVCGPPPSTWLPPMDVEALRAAARAELAGYWSTALRKRAIWRQDVYVDIGVTTWARADATIREGRLVTKTEAIARLASMGVPPEIVDGIVRRRRGETVTLTDRERADRAVAVRRLLREGVTSLLG